METRVQQEWVNETPVDFFDIFDLINGIKLSDKVLYHEEETAENFEQYIRSLMEYCDYDELTVMYHWLDQGHNELKASSRLESHLFSSTELYAGDLFFEKMSVNHERIKRIHKFVCERNGNDILSAGEYRTVPVNVGAQITPDYYQVYWHGAKPEDVKPFMDDFIKFYKTSSLRDTYSNPFIKSALAHLLFVRIHPFNDGNGRTARIIQNVCFTNGINRVYGTKLKLSPVNISHSISRNQYNYANRLNRIYFDLKHSSENEIAINNWLDFILSMYDEELFFQTNRLPVLLADLEKRRNDKLLLPGDSSMISTMAAKSGIGKLY